MSDNQIRALEYALAKQVPAMAGGFSIETSYGSLIMDGDRSAKIIDAVRISLEKDLAYAQCQTCDGSAS